MRLLVSLCPCCNSLLHTDASSVNPLWQVSDHQTLDLIFTNGTVETVTTAAQITSSTGSLSLHDLTMFDFDMPAQQTRDLCSLSAVEHELCSVNPDSGSCQRKTISGLQYITGGYRADNVWSKPKSREEGGRGRAVCEQLEEADLQG